MHIPDAYLGPATQAGSFVVALPLWLYASKRTTVELSSRRQPFLGLGSAFAFAVQMLNVPAPGGTTVHPLGAGLLAILVGPWPAVVGMTLTLAVQALLFGDGGILSLGANSLSMAMVAPLVTAVGFRAFRGRASAPSPRYFVAAGIAAYLGVVSASVCAAVLLGIQPVLAHDAAGHALYCPFGLRVTLPVMAITHLAVAGPADAIITVGALAYLARTLPNILEGGSAFRSGKTWRLAQALGWLLVLTPIGLLAGGSGFAEWGLDELSAKVGFRPAGMISPRGDLRVLLPDYGFAGRSGWTWEVGGYLLSAVVGVGFIFLACRLLLRTRRPLPAASVPNAPAIVQLPPWLEEPNPQVPSARRRGSSSLRRIVERTSQVVERMLGSEDIARRSGLLQALSPPLRAALMLGFLISAALMVDWRYECVGLLVVFLLAWVSKVDLAPFAKRLLVTVAFFGLPVLAFPVGQALIAGVGWEQVPRMLPLLLRLGATVGVGFLWVTTTRAADLAKLGAMLGGSSSGSSLLALSYRYAFYLAHTLSNMALARRARDVGTPNAVASREFAGYGAGVLFAKSLALAEDVHLAMNARGMGVRPQGIEHP